MSKQTPKNLKQNVLQRIDAARKAVEELSEEQLESIAGGVGGTSTMDTMMGSPDDGSHPGVIHTTRQSRNYDTTRRAYATTMAIPEDAHGLL